MSLQLLSLSAKSKAIVYGIYAEQDTLSAGSNLPCLQQDTRTGPSHAACLNLAGTMPYVIDSVNNSHMDDRLHLDMSHRVVRQVTKTSQPYYPWLHHWQIQSTDWQSGRTQVYRTRTTPPGQVPRKAINGPMRFIPASLHCHQCVQHLCSYPHQHSDHHIRQDHPAGQHT